MRTVPLAVGSKVIHEGEPYTVVEFGGRGVLLRRLGNQGLLRIELAHLTGAPGFDSVDGDEGHGASFDTPAHVLLDLVPKREIVRAQWRYEHLLEAATGYRSGDAGAALPNEPRRPYDPLRGRSLSDRFSDKAKEMRRERPAEPASVRSLHRWKACALDKGLGLLGLCDERYHQLRDPLLGIAPEVIAALDDVIVEHSDLSTVSIEKIRADVRRLVVERHGDSVNLPGRTRFYEFFAIRTRQTGAVKEGPYRRSGARRRPRAPAPLRATRSGELGLLDSTAADILVVDRRSLKLVRPEISVYIDGFDHSVRAVRAVPKGTRGVDAAFLLYDALRPKAWRPFWPSEAQWNYAGVPRRLVVEAAGQQLPDGIPARLPFGVPTTAVVDHGKIYLSSAFFAGCAEFAISVLPAPPGRPEYKGIVEQFFNTSNEWLWSRLAGHTGRSTTHRGRHVEQRVAIFLDELEDLFLEWAITVYQDRKHEGCRLPAASHVAVSPNAMYEYSLSETGFINAVPHPEQLVRLLPVIWRMINVSEVNIDLLRYWADEMEDFVSIKSPYAKRNKWPFHVDPRDLSRIWFQNPDDGRWIALHRIGARHPDAPFSDAGLAWVKRLIVEDGFDVRDREATNDALDAFLERNALRQPLSEREKRLLERMTNDTQRARADFALLDNDLPRQFVDGLVTSSPGEGQNGGAAIPSDSERLKVVPPTDDGGLFIDADDEDDLFDDIEPLGRLE
jgi:hypothetical protein